MTPGPSSVRSTPTRPGAGWPLRVSIASVVVISMLVLAVAQEQLAVRLAELETSRITVGHTSLIKV